MTDGKRKVYAACRLAALIARKAVLVAIHRPYGWLRVCMLTGGPKRWATIGVIMLTTVNIQSVLGVIGTAVTIVVAPWGVISAYLQWAAEVQARQAEIELRASKEFLYLIEFAHSRTAHSLSETCIEEISKKIGVSGDTPINPVQAYDQAMQTATAYSQLIQTACVYVLPVGAASQAAAMDMIASFGIRFPFLRGSARESLMALKKYKLSPGATDRALQRLENN
jgi:hypothetical protein